MKFETQRLDVILASKSASRAAILKAAGLKFAAVAPGVDEDHLKRAMRSENLSVAAQAMRLAEAKALAVAGPGLIIGGDQMLSLDGAALDKPPTMEDARAHLKQLRGRMHRLETAIAVAEGGAIIWRALTSPQLHMRAFSNAFLEAYLSEAGESVLSSVGAYQLEGLGAHLFERIEGDYFSILGIPLLPLLGFLRIRGVIAQ